MTDSDHEPDDRRHHPVPTDDVTPEDRARALQSLLVEKELLSTDAVDEILQAYEEDIGPMNGAEVVARAWDDPSYREWLLEDGTAAIDEMGYTGAQGVEISVVANTPAVHNTIVCTLCSCYPWPVLGLPPTWYKSPPYRSKIVKQPRATLREEFGVDITAETEVRVWDSTSERRYMVLPQRPPGTDGMDRDELAETVTRDAMIGVERLVGAPAADGGPPTVAAPSEAVDRTRAAVGQAADPPTAEGDAVFAAPWQARTYSIAVRLCHDHLIDRSELRRRLRDANLPEDADGYYRRFLATVERLLVDRDALTPAPLADRAAAFAAGDRDAGEFVHADNGTHERPDGQGATIGGHRHGGHDHAHSHHRPIDEVAVDEPIARSIGQR